VTPPVSIVGQITEEVTDAAPAPTPHVTPAIRIMSMFQRHLLNPEDKEKMEESSLSMSDVMHSAVRESPLGRLGGQGRALPLPRLLWKEVASNGAESILASGDNLTDLQRRDDVVIKRNCTTVAAQFSLPREVSTR
jgi:hypothetical protein